MGLESARAHGREREGGGRFFRGYYVGWNLSGHCFGENTEASGGQEEKPQAAWRGWEMEEK